MPPTSGHDDPNDIYAFSSADEDPDAHGAELNPAAEALLTRSYALLGEVESFQRSLRREKLDNTVVLGAFLNLLKGEQRTIQGLCLEAPSSKGHRSKHGVNAVNLPFYEAVWAAAKSTTGITALHKTFWYQEKEMRSGDESGGAAKMKRKKSTVIVDVVAQNGLQWIKINLLTPRRLLFDIAKAGWEEGLSSSDEEAYPSSSSLGPLATSTLGLTKLASTLLLAASQERVQYLHPSVYFIFPRLPLPTDETPEIKAFVNELTSLGVHVQCGPPSPGSEVFKPRSITELVSDISTPLGRRSTPITNPVNLDTTVLLALISDICNCASIKLEPNFKLHQAIANQMESEKTEPFLTTHLWPVLEGRDLVCTQVAADRFWEIVKILAGEKESERAALLMYPTEDGRNVERFEKLCTHHLPEKGLRLPLRILPGEEDEGQETEAMERVSAKLSAVNRGAFMGGWKAGLTTVTSNKTVARMIEGMVHNGEVGPDFYVIDAARSLVGYKGKRIEV